MCGRHPAAVGLHATNADFRASSPPSPTPARAKRNGFPAPWFVPPGSDAAGVHTGRDDGVRRAMVSMV